MGSFADGMKMGQNAYQMGINNRRQEEKDAREKVIQGREDTAYAREQAKLKNIDDATAEYGLMQKTGVRNQANIQANDVDFDMAVEATGRGLPMPAAQPQLPEWTRPTALQDNQGLQRLSMAREDFNGLRALKTEEGKLVENEAFKTHLKNYTGAPEQITPTARYLNLRSGAVTMHAPDKNGLVRLSVVKPDGDAEYMKLSRQDQAQLYAAGSMLTEYPERALQIMAGINKDLAAAIASENGLTGKLADNANDVATKGNAMRNDNARTGIASAGLALRREEGKKANTRADQANWAPIGVSEDGKGLTVYNKATHETRVQPLPPGTDAAGLFRKLTGEGSAGTGKGMAPMSKVEEAGTPYRDNATGALKYTDGRGGFVAEGGVLPGDRTSALVKAKLPDNLIGQLPWNADGTAVGYAGKAYRVGDPADMRQLAKDYERLGASSIEVDEAQKVDNHYMNNTPKTLGRSGSIYDTPAQRAAHTRAYDAR